MKTIIKLSVAAAIILAGLNVSFSVFSQENTNTGKSITVVSDDNYPPYIFRDAQGKLQGILVDKWQLWEQKTGIKVNYMAMDWEKAQTYMAQGKADVIDTIFYNEERAKLYDFSKPYAKLDVPLFFHKNLSGIADIQSLHGFTIGVKAGDNCIDVLKKQGITSLKEYDSYEEIVQAAARLEIKVFSIDKPPALYYLYKMNLEDEFRHSFNLYTGEFHRAVKKGEAELLDTVEGGFAKISQKERKAIENKWMGKMIDRPLPLPLRSIIASISVIIILIAALVFFNLILRGRVKAKTSELQDAVDRLTTARDFAENLIKTANTIIIRLDTKGNMQVFNKAAEEITGYTQGELLGKNWFEVLAPQDRYPEVWQEFARLMEGGLPEKFENPILTKDGEERYVVWQNNLIYEKGRVAGTISFGMDITERKKAEQKLRDKNEELNAAYNQLAAYGYEIAQKYDELTKSEQLLAESEKKFRDLTELLPQGIYEVDRQGNLTYANRFALDLFGYAQEDIERGLNAVDMIAPADRQRAAMNMMRLLTKGGKTGNEYLAISARGEEFPIMVYSSEIMAGENIIGSRGIIVDISENKRIEERLKRAEIMESLGMLAGGVAHDLNNILGVLVGYSELLKEKLPEGSVQKLYADNILQSAIRGAAVVQDLLTTARRGVSVLEVVNLNKVISDFFKMPEFENLRYKFPQVKVITELEAGLLNIKGSSVHLGKAVMNLLINAMEAISGRGEVTITTQNCYLDQPVHGYDDLQEGEYVVLAVSDTGKGISAGDLGRIFEPFYTTKVMGRSGTGLGLSVVWGTVRDHRGYIDVQSENGKGSVFTLYIPITREEQAKSEKSVSPAEYASRGETILVIDDVKEQREVAVSLLSSLGYQTKEAASGEEAVIYLKNKKVDLLVLDMIMHTGIDGMETYRQILEINPRQKAVIVSGFSDTDRVIKTQEMGAGEFVRKPYILERIGLAVRKELDRK